MPASSKAFTCRQAKHADLEIKKKRKCNSDRVRRGLPDARHLQSLDLQTGGQKGGVGNSI